MSYSFMSPCFTVTPYRQPSVAYAGLHIASHAEARLIAQALAREAARQPDGSPELAKLAEWMNGLERARARADDKGWNWQHDWPAR